ncbi:MAG: hypothetical protein KC877_03775 [Candidatus Kaiserbacteria bacterium]|nr:hypothetical protein [Candidatus Kaiserbacteria bacterium]MCB9816859.1 hypothetical protein [Candidatus Nomurabacteria bacterium]
MTDIYSVGNPDATPEFVDEIFALYMEPSAGYVRLFKPSDKGGRHYKPGAYGFFDAYGNQLGNESSFERMVRLAEEHNYVTYDLH